MAEKEQQTAYPIANGYARSSDTEAATAHDARELRKKKRNKCLLYVVLFVIFQTAIITVFALTIMKVRTPKFRIREATLSNYNAGTAANPSLRATLNAQFSVKNANFGRYKYRNTTVEFWYRGTPVGTVEVRNSRAGWRSTRRFNAAVNLNLASIDGSDLSAGFVTITSQARMRGRVELIFVMRRNRATNMNCTMEITTTTQQIRTIACK